MPKIKIVPFPGSLGLTGPIGPAGTVNSSYTPMQSSDWQEPQPTTIAAAIDQIAARLSAIEQS